MNSSTFRVLLASSDRCLLRRLARFLHTFAYETCAVADQSQVQPHLFFDPPDILILDENFQKDDPWRLCRDIRRNLVKGDMQTVALWNENPSADFVLPLEAGVDDFLTKPFDYGELLARLRSCARRLEFERRLRKQSGMNSQTGLLNCERFWEKLERARLAGTAEIACAMFEVDGYSAFALRYGTHAAESISRYWAALLSSTAPAAAIIGDLGEGRFGAVLPNSPEAAVTVWQETLRHKAAAEELNFGGHAWRMTASCAVVALPLDAAPLPELKERLITAVQTAVNSGGDCILMSEDLNKDIQSWTELAAPGKLFEHTTAANIMTPCTLVLREDDSVEKAASWLKRTHLPALPVIDILGKLRGMITAAQVSACGQEKGSDTAVKKVMCAEVPTFAGDVRMDMLRDYFALNASRFAFITSESRPVGWITPDTLMALIRPIHRDSFTSKTSFARSSEFLRVPDLSVL
jgi:DNA-binding response OmpR family regulator/predicted transcriptional regulator